MKDSATIWLPDAKSTRSAGVSLAATLYRTPLTVTLTGELGAGKTTFLQGFLLGLGIDAPVTSPTYALEQRYTCEQGDVLHIDLYRLDEKQAKELLEGSEDFSGIRCIEWSDRANLQGDIHIHLEEKDSGRTLEITFRDLPLPSEEQIQKWRDEVELPEHIQRHCDAVAAFAEKLGAVLLERGIILRPLALKRGGQLHDLLRFVDFTPGAGHLGHEVQESETWVEIRKKYEGMRHEPACAEFLREHGYSELARIVAVHGLRLPPKDRVTPEQKLLYYADKRMRIDTQVSLDERFADFYERYKTGPMSDDAKIWYEEASTLEKELFPEGAPT